MTPAGSARGVPRPPAEPAAAGLRALLDGRGFGESRLCEVLHAPEVPFPSRTNLPRLLHHASDGSPLSCLVRWFVAGADVAADVARSAFRGDELALLRSTGLLRSHPDRFEPRVHLLPFEGMWLAADPFRRLRSRSARDFVPPPSPVSRHLLRFTRRSPCRSALDLGTGTGVHAVAAAAHAQTVVATDLNPRATAYARFNAALNGVSIETLEGDLFAPVGARRFDLVVSNPPFILAPTPRFLFRDSGLELDAICERVVRGAADHLEDGGWLQIIGEWAAIRGQDWRDRVAGWIHGTGCDAIVLRANTFRPETYAQERIAETVKHGERIPTDEFDRWMAYYRALEVDAILGGLIALRRTGAPGRVVFDELDAPPGPGLGEAVERAFAAHAILARPEDDPALLDLRPRLLPGVRLVQTLQPAGGGWESRELRLEHDAAIPRRIEVDGDVAAFVARLDGGRTLRELASALAAEAGVGTERARRECVAAVRLLLARGLVDA